MELNNKESISKTGSMIVINFQTQAIAYKVDESGTIGENEELVEVGRYDYG